MSPARERASQELASHPPVEAQSLAARFPAAADMRQEGRELVLKCKPDGLLDLCAALRDEHGFDYLADLCGADCPELRLVVRLYCTQRRDYVRISVPLDRIAPKAPSLSALWPAADWQEREAYDLFGIRFDGHPDLRRILLPADWQGYPLLRDQALPADPGAKPDAEAAP